MSKDLALPKFQQPTNIDKAAFLINHLGKNIHEHAYVVGKILTWVKKETGHGGFVAWIDDNVWFDRTTATRYMNFSEQCDKEGILIEYSPRIQMLHGATNEKQVSPPLPEGKYNVIYADPPWKYEFSETESRAIERKYPTMELEQIKTLNPPISDNAVLYLWASAPKLEESLQVLNSWGFSYRTNAVWDKENIGMGYWFRGQHELLLVGAKGEVHVPSPHTRVSSVYREKRGEHSKKPEYYYEIIEKMYPQEKYLELFARNTRPNWTSWGNEIK